MPVNTPLRDDAVSSGVGAQAPPIDIDPQAVPDNLLRDDDLLAERPVDGIAPLAKSQSVKPLSERLIKLGHTPGAARAISNAVVDPAAVRRSLDTPIRRRVRGGTLLCVDAQVWPPAVCPSPTNPRGYAELIYPAGFTASDVGRRQPLTAMSTDPGGAPELLLEVADPAHLAEAVADAIAMVVSTNDLKETVGREGVLAPLLLVPVRVHHQDDAFDDIHLLVSADGSSRTVATWRHWDLDESSVYRHATDARALRQRMGQIQTLLQRDRAELGPHDLARLRVAQIPALVIIGYEPDAGAAGGVDLHQAVMSAVSLVHVDPPRAWATGSDQDVKATAVLEEFTRRGILTQRRTEWMASMLTADEAEEEGFSRHPDVRAAAIFCTLGNDRFSNVLNSGLRRLAGRDIRPRREKRLEVVCELMIRPHRRGLGAALEKSFRNALHRVLQYPRFTDYWRVTGRSPEALRDAALAELEHGGPGAAACELGIQGAFYLAMHGALRLSGPHSPDRREPAQELRDILARPHGIHLLAQAIQDGRDGIAPRAVRADGSLIELPTRQAKPVDDPWLRETFPNTPASAPAPTPPAGPDAPGPETAFVRAREGLRQAVEKLDTSMGDLRAPRAASGRPVVEEQGLEPDLADELVGVLQRATMTLGGYKYAYEARRGAGARDTQSPDDEAPDVPVSADAGSAAAAEEVR
ncbi:MAG TPA: hypothetical protein VGS19_27815 [Streptosporangiaceae bacterium]|nr:hypothetical protein [Streptosporangiaceae bacterium]